MPYTRQLDPKDVIFIQSRAEINHDVVAEYQTLMADGVRFDPASGLEDDSGQVFIWDGSHRGEAARRANLLLTVRLEPGNREQAEWLALSANQKHGLRRSRADKRLTIQQALRHPNGVSLSDREIARHCGVDHKTVGHIRSELEASGEIPLLPYNGHEGPEGVQQPVITDHGSVDSGGNLAWELRTRNSLRCERPIWTVPQADQVTVRSMWRCECRNRSPVNWSPVVWPSPAIFGGE